MKKMMKSLIATVALFVCPVIAVLFIDGRTSTDLDASAAAPMIESSTVSVTEAPAKSLRQLQMEDDYATMRSEYSEDSSYLLMLKALDGSFYNPSNEAIKFARDHEILSYEFDCSEDAYWSVSFLTADEGCIEFKVDLPYVEAVECDYPEVYSVQNYADLGNALSFVKHDIEAYGYKYAHYIDAVESIIAAYLTDEYSDLGKLESYELRESEADVYDICVIFDGKMYRPTSSDGYPCHGFEPW